MSHWENADAILQGWWEVYIITPSYPTLRLRGALF